MGKEVKETKVYKMLEERKSAYIAQVDLAIKFAADMLSLNVKVFDTYTIHGIAHAINVAEYMYELLENPAEFNDLELVVILYAALFHDVGMAVTQDEIDGIKADRVVLGNRKYSKVFEKYQNEHIALQECVRPVHGQRSNQMLMNISDENKNIFLIPGTTNVSFQEELATICQAHCEDFQWLTAYLRQDVCKGREHMNPQYIAMLLRIGDYLDMDEQRAPLYMYRYLQPKEYSDLEWKQHYAIENFEKILKDEKTGLKEIVFYGNSDDPSVHRKLLRYFDGINKELANAVMRSEQFENSKYFLRLRTSVLNRIQTKGFNISDIRLSLNYRAVTNLLMGEHIYGNQKYGLREIIQNSVDACKTMAETAAGMEEFSITKYDPFIAISLDKNRNKVTILDNGSGMSLDILKKYFLNVGISYYKSDDYIFQGKKYSPIGHYGIGFLACFMLSDMVTVVTRHVDESSPIRVEFEKNSEYISLTFEEKQRMQGTEIIFDYEQFMETFSNDEKSVKMFVEENFMDCGVPIRVIIQRSEEIETQDCELPVLSEVLNDSVCLNSYLNGIEAYVECNFRGIEFARTLSDLSGCDSYFYDSEQGTLVNEEEELCDIRRFIQEGHISCISCTVIEEGVADEFLNAYEILDDYEEALEKIDDYYLEYIMPKAQEDLLGCIEELVEERNERILGDMTFTEFCQYFQHSSRVPTNVVRENYDVIANENSAYVLPYRRQVTFPGRRWYVNDDRTYLKGVLLPKLNLELPYVMNGVVLKNARVNVREGEFFPIVSRENLSYEMQEKLNYAIGKALHLYILDHAELEKWQKSLVVDFIKQCYPENNECLKERDV